MILENIRILGDLNLLSITVRLFLAIVLGGILGIEREAKQRPAGLRTYVIVCLGATLASITNIYMFNTFGVSDPSRIPAQVISGIGFLGAGTIIVTRNTHVKGLTTAAGLWCSATIGIAVGSGFYTGAIIATIAIMFSLRFLSLFDKKVSTGSTRMSLYAEFNDSSAIRELIKYTKREQLLIYELSIFKTPESDNSIATFTIKMPSKSMREEIFDAINEIDGMIFIEEL